MLLSRFHFFFHYYYYYYTESPTPLPACLPLPFPPATATTTLEAAGFCRLHCRRRLPVRLFRLLLPATCLPPPSCHRHPPPAACHQPQQLTACHTATTTITVTLSLPACHNACLPSSAHCQLARLPAWPGHCLPCHPAAAKLAWLPVCFFVTHVTPSPSLIPPSHASCCSSHACLCCCHYYHHNEPACPPPLHRLCRHGDTSFPL